MTKEKIYQTALEQIESHLCANDFRAGVSAMQIIASKALAAAERLPREPECDPELKRLGLPPSWDEACAYALKVVPDGLTDDSEAGLYMTVRNAYISGVQRDDWGVVQPIELRAQLNRKGD